MDSKTQNIYSKNNAIKTIFPRGSVNMTGIEDHFDANLASFITYADANDSYRYLLVCNIYTHTFTSHHSIMNLQLVRINSAY